MKTYYEWDYETVDEYGDIQEHNHTDKLSQFTEQDKTDTLVLVRDTGDEDQGLNERMWAYVQDGELPEYFTDSLGRDTLYRVPRKYHQELYKYLHK